MGVRERLITLWWYLGLGWFQERKLKRLIIKRLDQWDEEMWGHGPGKQMDGLAAFLEDELDG